MVLVAALAFGGLASGAPPVVAWDGPATVSVPAGSFIQGSDRAEREAAYRLDERAYGHDATRRGRWYEGEPPRRMADTGAFAIMRTPVTNALYARFIAATGHRAPDVDPATWAGYGLNHPYARTRRHAWRDGRPPPGRERHPVVLVDHADAEAFAGWLSSVTGRHWRLPTAAEWEKAARGLDGRRFPWGDEWDPMRLNSADNGPFDTMPVGQFAAGRSPFGLLDGAGQVFEWTATTTTATTTTATATATTTATATASPAAGTGRFLVKGGSWDDRGCGVCRPAAGHGRSADLKHILIGFRLVAGE